MAEAGQKGTDTWTAAADLRAKQYHFVRASAADNMNQASLASFGSGTNLIGVLQTKPNSGQHGSVQYMGDSKVVAGGALVANTWITTNGSGRAAQAGSGDVLAGLTKQTAGADGDVITARLYPPVPLAG